MSVDLSKVAFSSTANYLKRSTAYVGSTMVTLPAPPGSVTHTVTHNLGYIPFIDVLVDFDNDGVIWAGEKIDKNTETSLSSYDTDSPTLSYWSTTTVLTIRLDNDTSPVASGSRTIYWLIYLDYGTS